MHDSITAEKIMGLIIAASTVGALIGGILMTMAKKNMQTIAGCNEKQEGCQKNICIKIDEVKKGQDTVFQKFDGLEVKLEKIFKFMGRVDEFMDNVKRK